MDAAVQQSLVEKQHLEIAKKKLLLEIDRLLQQIMSQDILLTMMNSTIFNDESVNMEIMRNESCDKCLNLDVELLKSQNMNTDLLKREAHIDYLNYTQEQADILQGIVKQAKANKPLDNALDFACKHAQRIQELLIYVRDTCPNAINLSGKKVAVTPKNKVKKVRIVELLTSSSNIKQILIDKIEKNKSLDVADYKKELYDALVKSYNTDKDIIESYGEVFSLKRSRDDKDKDQDPSAGSNRGTKIRKSSKDVVSSRDSRSKEKNSLSTFKDASQSQHKSSGKSAHAEEPSHIVEDSGMQQDQEFVTRDNDEQPADKEVTKVDWFKKPEQPLTPDPDWSKR
uniref:Uncharacterized protein n=1 Tax=Tanacetum cinerariifolium TaxID=118510 RepID=A0A6L2JJR9_TANCI|nr:hypothetical protein [Tanacetum cinerariifolium]